MLALGSMGVAALGLAVFVWKVFLKFDEFTRGSLGITFLLLAVAAAMARLGVRLIPSGVRPHELAVVALTTPRQRMPIVIGTCLKTGPQLLDEP